MVTLWLPSFLTGKTQVNHLHMSIFFLDLYLLYYIYNYMIYINDIYLYMIYLLGVLCGCSPACRA